MIGRLTFLVALSLAPMASAQDDSSSPVTPQELASARAIADRLISAENAEGIFSNTTTDRLARVTHLASGMTCTFTGAPQDRIVLFWNGPNSLPKGDDVGCVSYDEGLGIDLTLYATRYPSLPTEATILQHARTAIQSRWPDATPYTGSLAGLTIEGRSPPVTAAYKVQVGDEEQLTLAMITHRGAWSFKVRASGPYAQASGVGLYASVLLNGALLDRPTD